jgi:hypothetical protein
MVMVHRGDDRLMDKQPHQEVFHESEKTVSKKTGAV